MKITLLHEYNIASVLWISICEPSVCDVSCGNGIWSTVQLCKLSNVSLRSSNVVSGSTCSKSIPNKVISPMQIIAFMPQYWPLKNFWMCSSACWSHFTVDVANLIWGDSILRKSPPVNSTSSWTSLFVCNLILVQIAFKNQIIFLE